MGQTGSQQPVGDLIIIDDTEANLELLTDLMKRRGYRTRACMTPDAGWQAAHEAIPDMILLDVGLPGIDGFDLCRRFKADPMLKDVPVIFISAFDQVDHKVKGFQAGGVDYIGKPFHLEEVVARVESHMALKRVRQQEQELAVMLERNRIARELHDAVSQTLFSAGLMIDNLLTFSELAPDTQQALIRICQLTRSASAEMRTILYELRPEALSGVDLSELLTHLGNAVTGRTRATVTLRLQPLVLPDEPQLAFYRIAQEAINNVIKHAHATNVVIELACVNGVVSLYIEDNGSGFDMNNVRPGRFGLANMLERAERIDATLQFHAALGSGTRLRLDWQWVE